MHRKSIALIVVTLATATACSEPTPPPGCKNPELRSELGDLSSGTKTLRVRARIATPGGITMAVGVNRPGNDIDILNAHFVAARIRFDLVDVNTLPMQPWYYEYTSDPGRTCPDELLALSDDAITVLYVDTVTPPIEFELPLDCRMVVVPATLTVDSAGDADGISDPETLVHAFGHRLYLLDTHHFLYSTAPNDPNYTGDRMADTPFDPGLEKCTLVDPAQCLLTCSDGSAPDVHNFMSHYSGCRDRFSAIQALDMRCRIELNHKELVQ
jgi:hypothetical protein